MTRIRSKTTALRLVRRMMGRIRPRLARYEGDAGTLWFVGFHHREPSLARFYGGDEASFAGASRIPSWRLGAAAREAAIANGAVVGSAGGHALLACGRQLTVEGPNVIWQGGRLPGSVEALRRETRSKSAREDLRRTRKRNFVRRVVRTVEATREFHDRFYVPWMTARYPDDAILVPEARMQTALADGGELVCLDLDGEWVAASFAIRLGSVYQFNWTGVRDADPAAVATGVAAALYIHGLERAVESGAAEFSFGMSLPFLGDGTARFKSKWGGRIHLGSGVPPTSRYLMDLRHPAAQRFLERQPVVILDGDTLAAVRWLGEGDRAARAAVADVARFNGIDRWMTLGRADTLAAARDELAKDDRLLPIVVDPDAAEPCWLGEVLQASRCVGPGV